VTVPATIHVVDDDELARNSVSALVRSMGLPVRSYPSAEAFLEEWEPGSPGCLITDVRMLGMSGVELQQELIDRGITLPVIVITAFARTKTTVDAMQKGAVTVLDKPYSDDDLWQSIRQALTLDEERRISEEERSERQRRLATLTEKERAVLDLMLEGRPNKQIARILEVSIRTVENRRAAIFEKTETDSLAALIRLTVAAEPQ